MTTKLDVALTGPQASALFDILTHRETYAEIEAFKQPTAVHTYGPPFQTADSDSSSPILQTLLTRFFLPLPGVRDFGPTFWPERAEPLLAELAAANLSESFDKGDCGQRKTLATAISALLEYLARGKFGGLPRKDVTRSHDSYDLENPKDLVAGFGDLLQGLVYGDLLDELVAKITATDKLTEHSSLVQAAHRFILINVASFIHYTLIVSSKGPALLSLLENSHKLIPYTIMRQTLKVGNAATMISGMVRIVLAKASVGAVTNWLGLSSGSDEGMNLMQTIISTVLGWENRGLRKQALQIEKSKEGPSTEQLETLREYSKKPPDEQEQHRQESKQNAKSLVSTVLDLSTPLPQSTQSLASEYLTLQLSIDDRDRLINTLCRHNPDLTTPLVRAVVSAYDPVIRRVHQAVDLSAGLSDAENFINDLIALAKPKAEKETASASRVPVSSFVALCEKHQDACHRFLHQLAKNGVDLTTWYTAWVNLVTRQFQISEKNPQPLKSLLDPLLQDLSADNRAVVMKEIDAHAAYLAQISSSSDARASALLGATSKAKTADDAKSKQSAGPGMFLAKWQALIDDTEIGPAEDAVKEAGKDGTAVAGVKKAGDERTPSKGVEKEASHAPAVTRTLNLLLQPFRDEVRRVSEAEHWTAT